MCVQAGRTNLSHKIKWPENIEAGWSGDQGKFGDSLLGCTAFVTVNRSTETIGRNNPRKRPCRYVDTGR